MVDTTNIPGLRQLWTETQGSPTICVDGGNIINISGGQLTDFGESEDWLDRSVRLCQQNNVLIIAATGNDGCGSFK